jgi:nucleotide sugar dehydrogenase
VNILSPGPGVGGHCIPCDPHYLLWQLRSRRISAPLIDRAMASISERPGRVVARAREVLANAGVPVREAKVLVVGVTYKPGVEDVRESPALEILEGLRNQGAAVDYLDPLVPSLRLPDGDTLTSLPATPDGGYDLVVVHTRHPGVDHSWMLTYPNVLDATYRLEEIPHRETL